MDGCQDPRARGLDFWIGERDVSWADGGVGTNSIRSILGGCVILENFDASPTWDFQGMSVSSYSPTLATWQQTWVDNAGNYWHLTGGREEGRFVLATKDLDDGRPIDLRMVFSNIGADELDWSWERSDDGGATWVPRWQIHYRRKG